MRETLADMLNCPPERLQERLKQLEREHERHELQTLLSEHLPERLAERLTEKFRAFPQNSAIILLRTGALYPFVRPSALLSRLEGKTSCIIILAYPGTTTGELLGASPASLHRGYYRGETIYWEQG
ncbi:BREX protein BrxB domain-containing protein [Candidatus Bipolaricaulota sp. J31]